MSRLAALRESAERAAQKASVSVGAEVAALLGKLGGFEDQLKGAATQMMLSDDMDGVDAIEPKLSALHVLLVVARDAPVSTDLLAVLKPFDAVGAAADLEAAALSAAAEAVPEGARPSKKMRAD